METYRSIEILNSLIQINNDQTEGYEHAAEDTDDEDLKSLFFNFASISRRINDDLIDEVEALDGIPVGGTTTSGRAFTLWMNIKSALIKKDLNAILKSCKEGEDWAVKVYQSVLEIESEFLTADHLEMIRYQLEVLRKNYHTIKELLDELKTV